MSLGHVGIAAATAISAWLNVALLYRRLRRDGHLVPDDGIRRRLPRSVASALVMGAALFGAALMLEPYFGGRLTIKIAALGALVLAGIAVYFAVAFAIRAVEPGELKAALRRGGGDKKATPPQA